MENKLRAYMDDLFREVRPTRKSVELKEEILNNLIDKYHDLLGEGKTQEAAYNIAVASLGDMEELLAELRKEDFYPHSTDPGELLRDRKKSAALTTAAVMMYILSLLPPILLDGTSYEDRLAPALMFIIIAAATGLLIYNNMNRPRYYKREASIVEEFKEFQDQSGSRRRVCRSINSALWSVIVVIYIIVSFQTQAWHITWVIFLVGAALGGIIKALFELRK